MNEPNRPDNSAPSPGPPSPDARETSPPDSSGPTPVAFSGDELLRAMFFPDRAVAMILGERERLSRTVAQNRELGKLSILLLLASLLFALPYGALPAVGGVSKVAVLFGFSMLICFPSLHIFNQYIGARLDLGQNFALAAVFSAVAAILSFGFFPITWFIGLTMVETGPGAISVGMISNFLLAVAFALAILHLGRCFVWSGHFRALPAAAKALLLAWFGLLSFITYRMAQVLDLYHG